MIAANEAVARELTAKDFPTLYRVHAGPDEDALEALAPFLLSLGYRLPQNKENLPPLEIQRLLESARGKPEERVINRVLLRSMKQAVYQPENIGHFGLASTCYTHFTSPIRRYPDLIVHRMLDRVMGGDKLKAQGTRRSLSLPCRSRQTHLRTRAPRHGRRARNGRSQESPVHDDQDGRRVQRLRQQPG